jgi:hypothetical protein
MLRSYVESEASRTAWSICPPDLRPRSVPKGDLPERDREALPFLKAFFIVPYKERWKIPILPTPFRLPGWQNGEVRRRVGRRNLRTRSLLFRWPVPKSSSA